MKNKALRASLIKSAVLLVVLILLVYLTGRSPEGGIWHSLGLLFIGAFKTVQLAFGLILSLTLCLVVLYGIFLGAVAIVSKESAGRLYGQALELVAGRLAVVLTRIQTAVLARTEETLRRELTAQLVAGLDELRATQTRTVHELQEIREQLGQLERTNSEFVTRKDFDHLAREIARIAPTTAPE